jgi:spore coat polysaccharide biosynthesis protein SpsF
VNILVVIQARMKSTRLPGKIAIPVRGVPLLGHVVRRLQAAEAHLPAPLGVMVATSRAQGDDATEAMCRDLQVECFRGPEDDVLQRYLDATAQLGAEDLVIRATADNPLYCPRRTAKIILHHAASGADYTSIKDLSYVVPEVMKAGALRAMASRAASAFCREHVTPYFRQHPQEFRVTQLPQTWEGLRPEIRLTVDTPDELRRMTSIFDALSRDDRLFSLEEIYEFHARQPIAS